MNYDPKLKDAMEEIKAVIRKYDIGAAVTLVSPTHSEYLNEITPSWSCARFEKREDGQLGVRFKATLADYGTKEARHRAAELTTHLLLQIRDLGGQTYRQYDQLVEQLESQFAIMHKPFHKGDPTP